MAAWDPPQYVAKVDATENSKTAGRFGVKGYPSLHFFRSGQRSDYTGGRNEAGITGWIQKKLGPVSEELSGDAMKKLKDSATRAIVYVGPTSGDLYDTFILAAKSELGEPYQFKHTTDESVATEFGLDGPGISIIRNFDEKITPYKGGAKAEELVALGKSLKLARLMDFD